MGVPSMYDSSEVKVFHQPDGEEGWRSARAPVAGWEHNPSLLNPWFGSLNLSSIAPFIALI